jgi:hypothetical protein
MRVRPVGRSALLIECRDGDEVAAWRAELWRRREAGELRFVDIVPGATTILLDGVEPAAAALATELAVPPPVSATDGPLVEFAPLSMGKISRTSPPDAAFRRFLRWSVWSPRR